RDRLPRHRNLEPDGLGRVPQSIEMLLDAKDLSAIAAQSLKDSVAVQKAMIVDADLRVFFVVQLARDEDLKRHGILNRKMLILGGWGSERSVPQERKES